MDNITQEQIDALIEFIDNAEDPRTVTNVMVAAVMAYLNLKAQQMVTATDLANEATARQNADSLLQGLIDALNQTSVRYSDVGEVIAELSTGTGMLLPDQSPLVIFKSMGAAYDGVQRTVTLNEGEASYPGSGNSYRYNKRGTVYSDMTVTSNRVYFNSYTGRLYKWAGSSFEAIGGGMDGAIYDIIKSNVNLVAAKLDTLIGALAMLAFSGTVNKESLKVGSLSWVEPETHEPRIITPINGATIDCGTAYDDEYEIQKTIFVQGADLTSGLTLAITEGSQQFRLAGGSASISKAGALAGTNIIVIYTSSSSVANATGKLRIYSTEVDITVNLSGAYSEQGGGDEPVQTPSISVSPSSLSFNAEAGQSVQKTFTVEGSNLTGNIQIASNNNLFTVSPNSLPSSGGTVTVTYSPLAAGDHSGTITVSSSGAADQTVPLNGTATAAASTVNVVYKLLNFNQPSGATQDGTFGYYNETIDKGTDFGKSLSVVSGATLRDFTVKSGGVVKFKLNGSNNTAGFSFNNGVLGITSLALSTLTDDIIIEATAYTGTVTIVANAEVTGGVTINGTAQDLINGTKTFSYNTISSLSFSSAAKTAITSIDFGGAAFTGSSLASMFSGFTALTKVEGLVVTSSVTSLASLFSGCSALTSFDTIGWDTSAVTTIEALCHNCSALTKVDLGSKDMSSLTTAGSTDATGAFSGQYSPAITLEHLTTLDVSYWNAPNLVSLRAFIYNCTALTSFDASTWNAPNVANMWGMFASCSSITEIDISGISTANANTQGSGVVQIGHMFDACANLTKLTIGQFDTGNVSSVESVLYDANNTIALYCTSSVVPSINTTDTFTLYGAEYLKVWFGKNGAYSNHKYKISEVHVPSGKATDYYNAWGTYIGLSADKFIDDL